MPICLSICECGLCYFSYALAVCLVFVFLTSRVLLQKVFHFANLFLNIIVMTLGEIEFNDIFLENQLGPFYVDVRVILFIFLLLMPIVLMNLLVRLLLLLIIIIINRFV